MMVSRAYVYYGRPKSGSDKVAEFKLLRRHRQHSSTKEMNQRANQDESRLFKLSSTLQSTKANLAGPRNKSASTKMTWIGKKSSSLIDCDAIRKSTVGEKTRARANEFFPGSTSINPLDILPSSVNRPPPLHSPSSAANSEAGYSRTCDSTGTGPDEFRPPENRMLPREKKVTFILENNNPLTAPIPKKSALTAQVRRQNFRVSHSKGNRNSVNSSTDSCGNNVGPTSTDSTLPKTSDDCVTRVPEAGVETATAPVAENSALPKPAEKRIVSANTDRPKQQQMIKRKLKSCRSRSFHKSLDSSIVAQQNTRSSLVSYKRPLKAIHPEVVTMISLIGLHSEEGELTNPKAVNTSSEVAVSSQSEPKRDSGGESKSLPAVSIKTKSFDEPAPAGMIKFAGSTVEGLTFIHLNSDQRRNLFASSKNSKFSSEASEVTANVEQDLVLKMNTRRTKSLDSENLEPKFACQENQSFSRCVPLQSTKEKECWSSFHKMSKKGLFVSFDTILRGLLTPTEYRLRKDDLGFLAPE